ncbi:MAG: hypothetical protein LC097_09470 [Burkholderiales bacterium]|nr:hypothetical protein [Burkholderiales bacterium]
MFLASSALAASANSYAFRSKMRNGRRAKKARRAVNGRARRCVVEPSTELFAMNTFFILNAWPEDERDRKRAPARL